MTTAAAVTYTASHALRHHHGGGLSSTIVHALAWSTVTHFISHLFRAAPTMMCAIAAIALMVVYVAALFAELA